MFFDREKELLVKFLVNDVPGFRTKINAIILLFVVGVALLFGIIVLLVSMARGAVIIDREDSKIELQFDIPYLGQMHMTIPQAARARDKNPVNTTSGEPNAHQSAASTSRRKLP